MKDVPVAHSVPVHNDSAVIVPGLLVTPGLMEGGPYGGLAGTTVEAVSVNVSQLILESLGERRRDMVSVVFLTAVYCVIFVTGIVGNLSTCIVICRNAYMHTVTNYYLFNLAVSDVLTLLLALPPEVYSIWEAYPWRFGEAFCIFKSFLMEMTSYSSVLTITAFTVERYIAICHPIKLQKVCHVSRAIRCIIVIWTISSLSALPYPVHTRMFYYLLNPETGHSIPDSLVCNIPLRWVGRMLAVFQVSALIYFILPMVVITVLYILIGIRLRKTELSSQCSSGGSQGKSTATRARRAVLKMLVAVVVAFFVCWAPFHAQRLMSLYVTEWTQALLDMHGHLFYVSGVLYFLSSTVNPILYNLLSRKFRQAFKRTLCRCCLNFNTMPTFYKLKAKFINNNDQPVPSSASDGMYLNPNKNSIRMATFYRVEKPNTLHSYRNGIIDHPSTRDTQLNRTSWSSTCSSHAHSDGGLHYLCRHKRCMNRRQSQLTPRQNCQIASYQDIDSLRRKEPETPRRREPTNTLTLDDSITSADERPPVPVLRIRLDI